MGYSDRIGSMREELRALYRAVPAASAGFSALSKAVTESGPLAAKQKELIALGMALVMRCEPCINFHVEALIKHGASREELGDVLGMAIQMGGGPALMYAGHALACWDELSAARG